MTPQHHVGFSILICAALVQARTSEQIQLVAELSMGRHNYLLGMPIVLQLSLKNKGNSIIEGSTIFEEEIAIEVAAEGKNFVRVDRRYGLKNRERNAIWIRPGETLNFQETVCVDRLQIGHDQLGLGWCPTVLERRAW